MTALARRRPLAVFFVLAYLGSWLLWSPWWLSQSGIGVLPFTLPLPAIAGINQLGLFGGPFAAALLVARAVEGADGVRRLLRSMLQWRAGAQAYVLALVLIPIAAGLVYLVLPGVVVRPEGGAIAVVGLLAVTYVTYLFGGPVQEEIGWRGFALPRLQATLSPVPAALVLGVIHCCWHAPLFFTAEWDTARGDASQLLAYLLLVVSLSIVLSWLFNASGGSVLLAILGHNGLNWALFAVGTLTGASVANNWPAAIGLAALAIIGVALTRGHLAYSPDTPATVGVARRSR